MKKILLSAILIASCLVNAQELKFGAKLGLNISNFSGDLTDAKSLIGAQLGGFAEIKITDKFAVQPELLFSMQGSKTSYSETDVNYSYSENSKNKLNYLNIPVLAKLYISEKFALLAGPQFGLLMSAKKDFDISETISGVNDTYSESIDAKNFYKSVAMSFNLGTTYSITENIFVDARYNLGLSNISKNYTDENGDAISTNIKNNLIQFSVGYKF